jgi:hypothetical protein
MGVITITNGRHNNVGMEQGLQRDGKDVGQAPGVLLYKFHRLSPPFPHLAFPPAPAQDVARRIRRAWWARFTFNGITRYNQGAYGLVGGEEVG